MKLYVRIITVRGARRIVRYLIIFMNVHLSRGKAWNAYSAQRLKRLLRLRGAMLDPELKGKPLAVLRQREDRHGIVLTKSQQAKEAGVKTGMAVWQAKQLCPKLLVVQPHYDQYLKYSEAAHEIYSRYTDRIEPFGIDEVWLDITDGRRQFEDGKTIADEIRQTMKEELGLTVSIGVSYNKIFAKLGSDMKKPDGTTVISEDGFKEKVWPLPASDLLFVGRATTKRLSGYGITTIGGIANTDPDYLRSWFGVNGVKLWQFANGYDRSRVCEYGYEPPQRAWVTASPSLPTVLTIPRFTRLFGTCPRRRKEASGDQRRATAVSIYVRSNQLYWRAASDAALLSHSELARPPQTAYSLFCGKYNWQYPIRSLTIRHTASSRRRPAQTDLFFDQEAFEKQKKLENTIFDIRRRFGKNAVHPCGPETTKRSRRRLDEQFVLPNAMYQ